jgi:hypothetical protein
MPLAIGEIQVAHVTQVWDETDTNRKTVVPLNLTQCQGDMFSGKIEKVGRFKHFLCLDNQTPAEFRSIVGKHYSDRFMYI